MISVHNILQYQYCIPSIFVLHITFVLIHLMIPICTVSWWWTRTTFQVNCFPHCVQGYMTRLWTGLWCWTRYSFLITQCFYGLEWHLTPIFTTDLRKTSRFSCLMVAYFARVFDSFIYNLLMTYQALIFY